MNYKLLKVLYLNIFDYQKYSKLINKTLKRINNLIELIYFRQIKGKILDINQLAKAEAELRKRYKAWHGP
jgi:hypothetical protein